MQDAAVFQGPHRGGTGWSCGPGESYQRAVSEQIWNRDHKHPATVFRSRRLKTR